MNDLLPILWYFTICGELALYVLLDGANLGIGILSLFPQKEKERTIMMNLLGPIWNANETWIIVAAGTLFGAFPDAYALALNALYVPGVIVLVGIALRAVSFEFRAYSRKKHLWSTVFGVASLILATGQGLALGGLVSGIQITDGQFSGTAWDFFTPISLLLTIGIVCSYLVLGYAYLLRNSAYENTEATFPRILALAGGTFGALLGATILLPQHDYTFFTRWTTPPAMYALYADAALIALVSVLLGIDVLYRRGMARLYWYCLALFALGASGLLIGIYPFLIPGSLTLFEAASPPSTLLFMLIGIGPILPIILLYNLYLMRVFLGKHGEHAGYE